MLPTRGDRRACRASESSCYGSAETALRFAIKPLHDAFLIVRRIRLRGVPAVRVADPALKTVVRVGLKTAVDLVLVEQRHDFKEMRHGHSPVQLTWR
jgi:hypothetical protein